jgi:hypothetical protein
MIMYAVRLAHCVLGLSTAELLAVVFLTSGPASGQDAKAGKGKQPAFIPAGYDNYQNMLEKRCRKTVSVRSSTALWTKNELASLYRVPS